MVASPYRPGPRRSSGPRPEPPDRSPALPPAATLEQMSTTRRTQHATSTRAVAGLAAALLLAGCSSTPPAQPSARETRAGAATMSLTAASGTSAQAARRPLPIATGWGPSAEEIARARTLVGRLSLPERAG